MKYRRPSVGTSAPAISAVLRRHSLAPHYVRSDVLDNEWVVLVSCTDAGQATDVAVLLRERGYNVADQRQSWVIVKERQNV